MRTVLRTAFVKPSLKRNQTSPPITSLVVSASRKAKLSEPDARTHFSLNHSLLREIRKWTLLVSLSVTRVNFSCRHWPAPGRPALLNVIAEQKRINWIYQRVSAAMRWPTPGVPRRNLIGRSDSNRRNHLIQSAFNQICTGQM